MKEKEKTGSTKAYLFLYEQLRKEIREGRYQKNEKLPSKRQLADDFGVSVITVEHGLDLLEDEGYLVSLERRGYFVLYDRNSSFDDTGWTEKKSIYRKEDEESGNRYTLKEQGTLSSFKKSMRRVMNLYEGALFAKSPNHGCPCLREAIADYLFKNRGMEVKPEQIIIGAGAEYLYGILVLLLGKDKIYGIEKPSYEKIEQVYQSCGIKTEQLPLGPHGIESASLHRAEFQILHISPYRSYPSGVSADASKKMEYVKWADEKEDRLIIEDDFESEFYPESKPMETVFSLFRDFSDGEKVIYLNTFSKTISPSIRAGYLVLPERLLEQYENNAGFFSCTVPTFEQYVLADYLNSGEFARNINRIRRNRKKES